MGWSQRLAAATLIAGLGSFSAYAEENEQATERVQERTRVEVEEAQGTREQVREENTARNQVRAQKQPGQSAEPPGFFQRLRNTLAGGDSEPTSVDDIDVSAPPKGDRVQDRDRLRDATGDAERDRDRLRDRIQDPDAAAEKARKQLREEEEAQEQAREQVREQARDQIGDRPEIPERSQIRERMDVDPQKGGGPKR